MTTLAHDGKSTNLSPGDLTPARVNGEIYRPVDPDDPEIQRLAESIADCGLIHPIVVTADYVILSGHRRHCAAIVAELSEQQVARRMHGLHRAGLVEPTGATKPSRIGRPERVWRKA